MSTPTATECPHCHRDFASGQRGKHCPPLSDTRAHPTCAWVKHACGAVVDLPSGRHTHSEHKGVTSDWPCARRKS